MPLGAVKEKFMGCDIFSRDNIDWEVYKIFINTVAENHIGSTVSAILQYKQTNRHHVTCIKEFHNI